MRGGGFEIDDSELRDLQVDLSEAPRRVQRMVPRTLKRSAEIVDRGMVRDARGHRGLPRFPRNISHALIGNYEAEIGFDRSEGRQGPLVWIILEGSINNAPVWDYTAALRRSTPEILEMLAGTGEDAALGSKRA